MKNEEAGAEWKKGKERLEAAIGGGQKRREGDLEVLHGGNLIGDLQVDDSPFLQAHEHFSFQSSSYIPRK